MKKIINHLKENWIRHGFETLVVVGGVLIAFSLSNWNQDRLNLREEQRLLKLIHGEMDYYLWLQEKGTEKQENIIASVERLLLAMRDPLDSSTLDKINEDLHTVYSTRWFTGAGTANAVQATVAS